LKIDEVYRDVEWPRWRCPHRVASSIRLTPVER